MNKKTLIIKSQYEDHIGRILQREDTAIAISKIVSISKQDDDRGNVPFTLQVTFDNNMERFFFYSKRTRNRYFNKILKLIEGLDV